MAESWQDIILGEYEGGLEIFCVEDSFYMENINLTLKKIDDCYTLQLDSKINVHLEYIKINILSIESNQDENDVVYVDIIENQFYETKEVGAYLNTIYINDTFYSKPEGPNVEIRLSLVCQIQSNIRHIFIRAKKNCKNHIFLFFPFSIETNRIARGYLNYTKLISIEVLVYQTYHL